MLRYEEHFDIKHGNAVLELSQLVIRFTLVQCVHTMLSSFPFGLVMDIVYHCMLKVCDVHLHFRFIGDDS